MPRLHRSLCVATATCLILVAACSSNSSPAAREKVTALRGTIRSAAGDLLAGVSVSAGTATATSRADGKYDLRTPAGAQVVHFAKDGFVEVVAPVTLALLSPTQHDVAMLPMAVAMPLDATAGGTVTGARGAGLTAPAGAFVTASGAPVTGMVMVHLTPVDPSMATELRAASGDFTATSSGVRVALESFGMLDVSVSQGTDTLEVAAGHELEIRIPVASGATAPDAMIALWSIDPASGLWVDEGTAMLDAATHTYVAHTHHMSMWNADKVALATCVCGRVEERGAGPLPGAHVDAQGVDYFGSSSATTDDMGRFCIAVRKSSTVAIAAYHASGGGESRQVMSGAGDTTVPPTPGDPRCVDVGVWTVQRDVFTTAMGTVRCEDVSNPFATGCGADLWMGLSCYRPTGACTIRTDGLAGSTITYANGSHVTSTFAGMAIEQQMFSPSGTLCATSHIDTTGAGAGGAIQYTIAATGQIITMTIPSSDTGDMYIDCPGKPRTVVTPVQRQAVQACYAGSSSSGSGSMCTTAPGGQPVGGMCTATADCAGTGVTCCTIPMVTTRICLMASDCTAAGGT